MPSYRNTNAFLYVIHGGGVYTEDNITEVTVRGLNPYIYYSNLVLGCKGVASPFSIMNSRVKRKRHVPNWRPGKVQLRGNG